MSDKLIQPTSYYIYNRGEKPKPDVTAFEYDMVDEWFDDRRVRFSLDALDNATLDRMVASADVGLAIYSVERLGYRAELMGLAGGKIGNYLKCGVPVVATRLPSLRYLEEYGCGILIDDESEIPTAVATIRGDIPRYKSAALRCYNALWHPAPYLQSITATICPAAHS